MRNLPIWILRSVAILMVAADIVLLMSASRFSQGMSLQLLVLVLVSAVVTAIPYFGVTLATMALATRYLLTHWALLLGILPIVAASLLLRFYEYGVAHDLWHAKMSGYHYMNCGPPARLGILFLDYCGTGAAAGVAGGVFLVQLLIAALNIPSPPSPPPSPGHSTPR